jgi:hypothetical protein
MVRRLPLFSLFAVGGLIEAAINRRLCCLDNNYCQGADETPVTAQDAFR